MGAPSRSRNYRTGSVVEIDKESYYRVLTSLKQLDKEANKVLRAEAREIADDIVKPIVQANILRYAANFGPKLAASVRSTRDRIPKVVVGRSRGGEYSGGKALSPRGRGQGASTNMLRYGTIMGPYFAQTTTRLGGARRSGGKQNWPESVSPKWTDRAASEYNGPTFEAWERAVDRIVTDYNRGRI